MAAIIKCGKGETSHYRALKSINWKSPLNSPPLPLPVIIFMHSRSCSLSASKCFPTSGPQREAVRRTPWCSLRQFNLGERERKKTWTLINGFSSLWPSAASNRLRFFKAALSSRSVNAERTAKGECASARTLSLQSNAIDLYVAAVTL